MIIPAYYQVFDSTISVESKDAERLTIYLVGWEKLSPFLSTIAEPDLMRLVVMELCGKKRMKLIDRLLMRLGKMQRRKINARISKCLTHPQSPR